MKNGIYFLILVSFTACKLNSNNEVASEVTETTAVAQPIAKADTVIPQQVQKEKNQPKTKDELWNEYWTKFTTAIKQRDKSLMLELALKPNEVSLDGYSFDDGGGGGTAVDFVNYIDEDDTWKGWLSIANDKKAKIIKEKNRTIVENYMIFEIIKGEWVWTGVMGD